LSLLAARPPESDGAAVENLADDGTDVANYGITVILRNTKTACNAGGTTFEGIPPFAIPSDISTPNPMYFQRASDMLTIAAAHGITILLDAVETDGWLATFKANGREKASTFGRYLGNHYKDVPNIIWMYGNDFQTWMDSGDDAVLRSRRGNGMNSFPIKRTLWSPTVMVRPLHLAPAP
jgi:hypothetical protein